MQKTKMIFTIGPASDTEEVLSKLIEAGMSASRHNFSHGDHQEHGERIELVKKLRKKYNKQIGIILDTKGPEIRTGYFPEKVELVEGTNYTIVCGEDVDGDATRCNLSYRELYKDVKPGDMILMADGLIGMEVQEVKGTDIHCIIRNSGMITTKKNANVPNVKTNLPAFTEKDVEDLKFGCEIGVDYVAASFIRKSSRCFSCKKIVGTIWWT